MSSERTRLTVPTVDEPPDPAHWTACLVVVRGAGTGERFLLNRDELCIGRSKDTDMRLRNEGVSRRHALIRRVNEGRFVLMDNGSTNGTFVNGERIDQAELADQDLIGVGDSRLRFVAADSPEQAYYEELYRHAQLDKSLQIYNKHYFLTRLDEELKRHQRIDAALSLIMLDVDHFKKLNDNYGHLAGDAALVQLAANVSKQIRDGDVLCRYGGEEFGIILPQTDKQQTLLLAEQVRQMIAKIPVAHDGRRIDITASLGISTYPGPENQPCTAESLIAQADKALYHAKHNGRNKVSAFVPEMASKEGFENAKTVEQQRILPP